MKKLISKSTCVLFLPLLATAIVCADSLRTTANIDKASLSRVAMSSGQQEESALDQTLSAHYVQLNENNQLTGVISTIDNQTGEISTVASLDVFLVQSSQIRYRTKTDADGAFLTEDVLTGSYTLCAAGPNGFLAYGIHVVRNDGDPEDRLPVPLPDKKDAADSDDKFSNIAFRSEKQEAQVSAAVIPPEFNALRRIMTQHVPDDVGISETRTQSRSRINVEKSVASKGFQIELQENGNLAGRVAPLGSEMDVPTRLREMNVFLIQNDEIYADVSVESNGSFEFVDVEPGVYGFAAAGPGGFAALSFEAVKPGEAGQDTSTDQDSPFRTAAATKSNARLAGLSVALSPPEDVPFIRNRINALSAPQQPVSAPPPVAQTAPIGGGAGGPIGPSGGSYDNVNQEFGGLIGAALAAWVLVEAIDSRNQNLIPPPVSPFTQ